MVEYNPYIAVEGASKNEERIPKGQVFNFALDKV
jgi:hypothetical protein